MNVLTEDDIVESFERHGIDVVVLIAKKRHTIKEFVCRKNSASFALCLFTNTDSSIDAGISADLSEWRWWNFPYKLVKGLLFIRQEIRLQDMAYKILLDLGGRPVDE